LSVRDLPAAPRRQRAAADGAAPLPPADEEQGGTSAEDDAHSHMSFGAASVHSSDSEAQDAEASFKPENLVEPWAPVVMQPLPSADAARALRSPPAHGAPQTKEGDEFADAPPFLSKKKKSKHKNIPAGTKTAAQFAALLFTDDMVETFVFHTNAAAREHPRLMHAKRYQKWKDLDIQEFRVFMAVVVYLGVVKVQNRSHIWKKKSAFSQAWVTSRMSLYRFESIVNAWNCATPWLLSDAQLKDKNVRHAFWQVQPLVNMCNTNCAKYFRMGRLMSIDEGVIPFKGKHRAKCYNPSKPAKYHIKKFCLNCAKTGYNYCHYFYEGKGEERPDNVPATTWPVKKLLGMCPELHGKDRILAVDNWFQSSATQIAARRCGVHCIGTVKTGRLAVEKAGKPGFPKAGIFKVAKGQPKADRGSSVCHVASTRDGTGGTLKHYVTAWQDKRAVCMLSTYPPKVGTCIRKVREPRGWTEQTFHRPTVIAHYNSAMGGTDKHDMMLAFARSTVKSSRWQVRVFSDMISSMMTNALVLMKSKMKLGSRYTIFNFISDYLQEVAPLHHEPEPPSPQPALNHPAMRPDGKIPKVKASFWGKPAGSAWRMDGKDHWCQDANNVYRKIRPYKNSKHQSIRFDLRRKCRWCNKETVYFCTKCHAPLCIDNCFMLFHTNPKLPSK
jgi:hypothetical protein